AHPTRAHATGHLRRARRRLSRGRSPGERARKPPRRRLLPTWSWATSPVRAQRRRAGCSSSWSLSVGAEEVCGGVHHRQVLGDAGRGPNLPSQVGRTSGSGHLVAGGLDASQLGSSGDLKPCRLSEWLTVSPAYAQDSQSVLGAVGVAETKVRPESQNTIADLDHPTLQAIVDVAGPRTFIVATSRVRGEGNRRGGLAQTPPQRMQDDQGAVRRCVSRNGQPDEVLPHEPDDQRNDRGCD